MKRAAALMLALCLVGCTQASMPPASTEPTTSAQAETTAADFPYSEYPFVIEQMSLYNATDGYGIYSWGHSTGTAYHELHRTTDGGATWEKCETNLDNVYPRNLTGLAFRDADTGLAFFRAEFTDFTPAVLLTRDGGLTWEKLTSLAERFADRACIYTVEQCTFDGDGCTLSLHGKWEGVEQECVSVTTLDFAEWTLQP